MKMMPAQCCVLCPAAFLIISFTVHLVTASHKKFDHQEPISVDYFGQPILSGEDYEEAKLRSAYASSKVKRQNDPARIENEERPTTDATSAPTPVTTLPPSVSTSLNEDDNITVISTPANSTDQLSTTTTETVTSSSSTTTEATTPSSSTTTTEEPSPIIPLEEGHSTKGYFCLCDYQVKVCDMNCCCDPDCSDEEKTWFKRCDDASLIYDPSNQKNKDHNCFKSYIMYRDNIPYVTDRTDKSLFCIVKENVKQTREFSRSDMAKISSRISHGKIDTRPKYTWDTLHEETKVASINYNKPYKYGSPIWSLRRVVQNGLEVDSQEIMFRLPAAFHTDTCSILEPVKYLQDSVSQCTQPLYDVRSQCKTLQVLNANHFIKNFMIIANPSYMDGNDTDSLKQIIPVKWCYETTKYCHELTVDSLSNSVNGEDIELPQPELGGIITTDKCTNVMQQLNLTFVHEGLHGITTVLAKVLLRDIPLGVKEIVQVFQTEFIWNNAVPSKTGDDEGIKNGSSIDSVEDFLRLRKLPRSGNPGYIVGKPLILGRKVLKRMAVNDTEGQTKFVEKMQVLPDVSQWLHIQGAGDCPLTYEEIRSHPRHPILFGYDHISSCNLPLDHFHDCGQLKEHIASVIFGLTGDINPNQFTMSPLYVAAYGSPDAFPSDWVPLTFVGIHRLTEISSTQFSPSSLFLLGSTTQISSGCGGVDITTSIHITITYAYVGPVDAPQAKITGIFYEPEESVSIPDYAKENRVKEIPVTTTVSFLDVTGKPTTRVATFPVVSVQLPGDFFYPFSSSTSGPSSGAEKRTTNNYYTLSSSLAFICLFIGTLVVL